MNEPYEILVVDDVSTDATTELAVRHGARAVPVHHRQIAAARNSGARQAQGDLLIFVDADTEVTRVVVHGAVQAMRTGAVGGGARARFDGYIPLYGHGLAWIWYWLQLLGNLASGCFIFCTRQAFEEVGGFDETLYAAEDLVLSQRLKRLGRFVILREEVITSGRSVRSHTGVEIFSLIARFMLHGTGLFKTRHGPWYSPRRDDPDSAA